MTRNIIALGLVMGLVTITIGGCSKQTAQTETEEKVLLEPVGTSLDTDIASVRDVYVMESVNGSVIPNVTELSLPVDGQFVKYYVFAGDTVSEGDIIAEISQDDVDEQIESLETQIQEKTDQNAKDNHLTEIDLAITALGLEGLEGDTLAMKTLEYQKAQVKYRQTVERQQMELEYLNQQLAKLQEKLGETAIVAPSDGIIVAELEYEFGDYISADTPIVAFAADIESDLRVTAEFISEKDITSYADYYAIVNGERVDITYEPYTKEELSRLSLAGAALVSYYTIDSADTVQMGDFAKICYVKEQSLQTLAVVSNAVYKDITGYYVYVIGENNSKVRQDVEVGVKNSTYTEILSGLQEGDVVYVQNQ